jgi:hypothetical protein
LPSSVIRYSTLMDSPRDREDLLREITEICGAAGTVGVGVGVADGVGDADGVGVGVGVRDADGVGVGVGDADGVGVGVGDATTTEAVPSKTKSVQLFCASVVCVLKVYVPAISAVPQF